MCNVASLFDPLDDDGLKLFGVSCHDQVSMTLLFALDIAFKLYKGGALC